MGKNIETISAREARKIVESSTFAMSSVFKWIADAAKHCSSEIMLSKHNFDKDVFSALIEHLKTLEYTVIEDELEETVIIRW